MQQTRYLETNTSEMNLQYRRPFGAEIGEWRQLCPSSGRTTGFFREMRNNNNLSLIGTHQNAGHLLFFSNPAVTDYIEHAFDNFSPRFLSRAGKLLKIL